MTETELTSGCVFPLVTGLSCFTPIQESDLRHLGGSMSKRTVLGVAFILMGVVFVNSWFVSRLAPDGEIGGLPYNLNIILHRH